ADSPPTASPASPPTTRNPARPTDTASTGQAPRVRADVPAGSSAVPGSRVIERNRSAGDRADAHVQTARPARTAAVIVVVTAMLGPLAVFDRTPSCLHSPPSLRMPGPAGTTLRARQPGGCRRIACTPPGRP